MKSTKSRRVGALGWATALATFGLCVSVNLAQAANQQLAGVWRVETPVFAARTIDGKTPPLKPQAAKLYAERQSARKAGDASFDSATWCASVGLPRIMLIDYPFEIVVREPYVAFLHQWNWWARVVYLDGALSNAAAMANRPAGAGPGAGPGPAAGPPADALGRPPVSNKEPAGPMGLSKGRWEGDTLSIETSDLSHLTMLDSAGMPHSSALKIIERMRLRSPDVLENRIRIEDPEVFTEAWETLLTYKRQRSNAVIEEDVCLDRVKNNLPAVKE